MAASDQLRLAVGATQNRNLFPAHFLEDRLPEWSEYAQLESAELLDALVAIWERERELLPTFNEEQTEDRLIRPILAALGFQYTARPNVPVAGRRREPDYALFLNDEDRREAERLSGAARYASAVALLEAKRFDRPLDRRRASGGLSEDPVAQIIFYISTTLIPFGILTNGRIWRLYAQQGDLVEGAYYEVDLVALLEAGDAAALRRFAAFFSAASFRPDETGKSFLDRALSESRANAVEIGDALQRQVFAAVPNVALGLLGEDEPSRANLDDAFEHALVFLYRLLFCLHAEARGLLPVSSPHYLEYSIRKQRQELAEAMDRGRVFSHASDRLYNELEALFKLVAAGDEGLGVNEYSGDLFAAAKHPWLIGRVVPDDLLATALDGLYRLRGQAIDYRDLSVRQLGTIYERLLEYELAVTPEGGLELQHAPRTQRHRLVLHPGADRRPDRREDAGATAGEALGGNSNAAPAWQASAGRLPGVAGRRPGDGKRALPRIGSCLHRQVRRDRSVLRRTTRLARDRAAGRRALHLRRRPQPDGGRAGQIVAMALDRAKRRAADLSQQPAGGELVGGGGSRQPPGRERQPPQRGTCSRRRGSAGSHRGDRGDGERQRRDGAREGATRRGRRGVAAPSA